MTEHAPSDPIAELESLIAAVSEGDRAAEDELWERLYNTLKAIAARQLSSRSPETLQATALLHEAYLRLRDCEWSHLRHFYGAAARAMRNVLVDSARRRGAVKRGPGRQRITLSQLGDDSEAAVDLIDLDDALEKLQTTHERACDVVQLRYFAGLTIEETAKVLDISENTVDRDWSFARAWLHRELESPPPRA